MIKKHAAALKLLTALLCLLPAFVHAAAPTTSPSVIWFHSGVSNSVESLDVTLSSRLVTHVLLLYMHRADADWTQDPKVLRAIDLVTKSPAKLIWARTLWPYYRNEGIDVHVLVDADYYVREINALRAEAWAMGADYTAVDTEPYGDSPLRQYLKVPRTPLDDAQMEQLRLAVADAVREVGLVDYVLPAGWFRDRPAHPYRILAGLGRLRITQKTYYASEETIKLIQHPYEVFGAHVSPWRHRPINPKAPHYLVFDILGGSHLWQDRKHLFLYSTPNECLGVARDLVAYGERAP